ncbi:glycerol-3-phosphate dehydrogenase/oxidase [Fulvivirga ulvae]|uniref:glycerol-3-phosphate dehydrogenase/oxidase n=1 Tax=Fulvivirga ulvae TaxID=2904245 RepID=UPI001F28A5D9|nr:glycerol-3-phosphate dehydrogenase/oxidase [Fulvivirga ulvae]UII30802.1 glycerol-3-phosphate dehydrogenase/oxidase [Fulvivirga ulvae]
MITLSALDRSILLNDLQSSRFDLLVIGGGITGVGIALDAASRGIRVALVEKEDFASGTSSRSTKLIHGGLRYLKQFEIALVREVGRERATLHRLAPHLVTAEKMLLPLIKGGNFGKLLTSFGLMVYDVLADVQSADQRKMLDREEALSKEPLLDKKNLEGAGIYAEYRTDDARLTIEVMKAAAHFGATCLNYVEALELTYHNNRVTGVKASDKLNGNSFEISADLVVSATGPWVDEIRKKDHSLEGKRLHLTKGVHIVVDHEKLPVKQAVYFDVPDGRMIFAIPRGKITYIGTTDTDYFGNKEHVLTNREDVEYLIDAVNHAFPDSDINIRDVRSSWAGLRPLIHEEGKSASELSRKDEIFVSDTGLISIAGGKLTGYRKMAERVTDLAIKKLKDKGLSKELGSCRTNEIPLGGGKFMDALSIKRYTQSLEDEIDQAEANYLVGNYGTQTEEILKKRRDKTPYALLEAECQYCIENELVNTLCDFFIRRTGKLYFDIESVKANYKLLSKYMQNQFSWSGERLVTEIKNIEQAIHEASHFDPIK